MSAPHHPLIRVARRLIYGRPKRTDQERHERLGVAAGLAVFSADAISSVAYATEEILLVLVTAGTAAAAYSLPIGLGIVLLVFIVAASYNQTIHAYPGGGGSYIVSKDNLGTTPGLVAGAALLVDYVLTVAVSTASGVAAITSAIPALQGHQIGLGLAAVAIITWVNLRGVKESGAVFSVPTYSFIVAMFLLIAAGVYKAITGTWHPAVAPLAGFGLGGPQFRELTQSVTLFMILHAFSSGCTALTGIEAVSNGVQAFQPPEAENAVKTMKLERTILYTMFAGVTLLTFGFNVLPKANETVLSQLGREIFGTGTFYYFLQATTALILLLAANTAFADFPRLVNFIARDGFLTRQLANRGDTLVYNRGITLLAVLAITLIIIFRGSVHLLIPLYAVGVFLAFTLSQTGMVVHWVKHYKATGKLPAWSIFINGLGAILCAVVLVVITLTKFTSGAWIVALIIPITIAYFFHVHDYYVRFRARVESLLDEHMIIDDARKIKVVLTIGHLSPVIDHSLKVARKISDDITAVFVAVDPQEGERIARKWDVQRHRGVQLKVLPSPYRTVAGPLRRYLEELLESNRGTIINLLVPIILTNDPFDDYLHNGTADQVLRDLRFSEGIIITVIPFYVNVDVDAKEPLAHYPK